MDFHSIAVGLCLGVPLGIGAAYLFTHPEARSALFARVSKTASQVHDEIAAAIAARKK